MVKITTMPGPQCSQIHIYLQSPDLNIKVFVTEDRSLYSLPNAVYLPVIPDIKDHKVYNHRRLEISAGFPHCALLPNPISKQLICTHHTIPITHEGHNSLKDAMLLRPIFGYYEGKKH